MFVGIAMLLTSILYVAGDSIYLWKLGGDMAFNRGGARLKYTVGSAPYIRRGACAGFFVSDSNTTGAKSYIHQSLNFDSVNTQSCLDTL